jgi:hypothetical protein
MMKKRPPPTSIAKPTAIGPTVVRGAAAICGPPVTTSDPTPMEPDAINQKPRTTNPVATIVRAIRIAERCGMEKRASSPNHCGL